MKKIKNTSGIEPLEYNVLIKPQQAGDHKFVSPTGKTYTIHKPDEVKDREVVSSTEGQVIAVSPSAFDYVDDPQTRELISVRPGDNVLFSRHQALETKGRDGDTYFLMKDKVIAAVFRD